MTTARVSAPPRRTSQAKTAKPSKAEPVARAGVLQRPLASYYLVGVSSGLLVAIGFVMVLSASSVRSYATYGSSYTIAVREGIYVVLGLVAMWVSSRVPVRVWRLLGTPLLLGSVGLLVLVLIPGIGHGVDGARRWIPLPAGATLQPSEIAKLGLVLWGADLLVRKKKLLRDWKHLLVPLVPAVGLVALLVMLEPDMGTTIVVMSILVALLWVVGTPFRVFSALLSVLLLGGAFLVALEPYRLRRVVSFLDPCSAENRLHAGYQACQGLQAMTSGGWFGLGLGASSEKWVGGLPNPYTDFIYAIVGEELGLLGTLTVLVLFAVLTYSGFRIAKRTKDPFVRLAAAGITVWVTVQALVNIGTVVGLVPITGIPLPLISFGGSALVLTMAALGMLMSFARTEPGAEAALKARRGWLRAKLRR